LFIRFVAEIGRLHKSKGDFLKNARKGDIKSWRKFDISEEKRFQSPEGKPLDPSWCYY